MTYNYGIIGNLLCLQSEHHDQEGDTQLELLITVDNQLKSGGAIILICKHFLSD